MEKIIIFYDDTKTACIRAAEKFGAHENTECRKASEYRDKTLVFAMDAKVGFIFEAENGRVPYVISHIIWRMSADKNREHMLMVTGGRRELKAIRTAEKDMEKRGYHVGSIYTRYILDKYKLTEDESVGLIIEDMITGKTRNEFREKYSGMSRRELMKHFRNELKAYRKFQKSNTQKRKI
ncbi:hypothetical protein LKD70_16560 [Ruminococcus sp. CLA-AA-H200]|uniref:Uncharacterized protein n=1 Tax=Ruminococcus turbiniformis TaxID=2881258 RepID=A0ABS8G115_9FIRM|nr:hypothetical protein [Ruminococcus turbiniformis]MCC2256005.1 hypothetical protein [Ruminococcus turbiniformis]